MSIEEQIKDTVTANDVVLFMKGTKAMPQCGFSNHVVGLLSTIGIEFQDVNVLADPAVRQGIKDYSDWPTIPQLYVKGEFVGGCDIISEMTMSGELETLLDKSGVSYSKEAAQKIRGSNS
jgi:monothiol glutaredoxin